VVGIYKKQQNKNVLPGIPDSTSCFNIKYEAVRLIKHRFSQINQLLVICEKFNHYHLICSSRNTNKGEKYGFCYCFFTRGSPPKTGKYINDRCLRLKAKASVLSLNFMLG